MTRASGWKYCVSAAGFVCSFGVLVCRIVLVRVSGVLGFGPLRRPGQHGGDQMIPRHEIGQTSRIGEVNEGGAFQMSIRERHE